MGLEGYLCDSRTGVELKSGVNFLIEEISFVAFLLIDGPSANSACPFNYNQS